MSRSDADGSEGPRGSGPRPTYYSAVVWIALLLIGWFLIAEWHTLPQLIETTRAALP